MLRNAYIQRVSYLCLMMSLSLVHGFAQVNSNDNFQAFVKGVEDQIVVSSERNSTLPNDEDLRAWTRAFYFFRMHSLDSCKAILSQQNYSLVQIADHRTGHIYDVFRENNPIRKSWGTFIYNRQHAKRLFIHITHPDDGSVAQIGAELFQKTQAEWLYIAGTSRTDKFRKIPLDAARLKEGLLQRWHEIFTDLTHITLSLHGFDKKYYAPPVTETDIVLSNGKTSDDQWGISQISLLYRDSLRMNGFSCGVAMYDSGFASLAWGVSPQGMFSNDSVGFGHWMNVELSKEVRSSADAYSKFIALTDRAFEVAGKKISQQVNRAFGLVSPRTLRLDSRHGLLFPVASSESYRIVSFDAGARGRDTIRIRVGSWLQFPGASQALASMEELDSAGEGIIQKLRRSGSGGVRSALASIIEQESPGVSSYYHAGDQAVKDSSVAEENDAAGGEPMQVHRIPLRRSIIGGSGDEVAAGITPFRWQGSLFGGMSPASSFLRFATDGTSREEAGDLPNFLIPIINSSFGRHENNLVEIQMTRMLARQIAQLISEHREQSRSIQLLAEVGDDGDYYLRVFPSSAAPK